MAARRAAAVCVVAAATGFGAYFVARAPRTRSLANPTRLDERMLAALHRAAERTDETNSFLGTALLRDAQAAFEKLPATASTAERVAARMRVGNEALRVGDADEATANLRAARSLALARPSEVPPELVAEVAYRLGVACLRVGENENCCVRPTAQSCILPISGTGVHAASRGSTEAIERFREVLRATARDSSLHLRAKWLLNLAAMTLGRLDELPADERLPRSTFDSGVAFPRFENVAGELGCATSNLAGGAVVEDLDGDGRLDILTSTSDPRRPPTFLHGREDGRFEDRTSGSGLEEEWGGLNMVDADYDGDGAIDVVILRGGWFSGEAGRVPFSLLHDDGAGHFTDVTFAAGLGGPGFPTQTAAWADYDGDGRLDLYVGAELREGQDCANHLFHNEGDGTFTDVTEKAGVTNRAFCKAVVWGDYDGDGRPDVFVSNCGGPNRLYRNNGNGTFTDVAAKLGVERPYASFGAFFFDYDDDGVLDLFVAGYRGVTGELARVAASASGEPLVEGPEADAFRGPDGRIETQRLFRGDGRGGFVDVTAQCGLDRVVATMGLNFGDLDGDGRLDFYLGTGYPDFESLMPNRMFLNQDGERFLDVTWAGGFGHLQKGHAVAFADFRGDGRMDVFEETGGSLAGDRFFNALYRNPGFGNHWLEVRLEGRRSNRCAIGARIRAEIVENGRRRSIFRTVNTGGSFGCNPLRQTIGLGKAARVERLEVFWPTTGLTQTFADVAVDRAVRIVEGVDRVETVK